VEQQLFKVSIPEGEKLYGPQLRQLVGEAHKGVLDPEIFNKDENNRPLNKKPSNRFYTTRNEAVFISEGENAVKNVQSVMGFMLLALKDKFPEHNITFSTVSTNKSASVSAKPIIYSFHNIVKKRRNDIAKELSNEQTVKNLIIRELESAYRNGLIDDLPPTESLLITFTEVNEKGVKVTDAGGEYASMFSGKVVMNIDLKGSWQIGSLTAKGYGRFYKEFVRGGDNGQ
jgi:hypothetical protein